ncbi:MAG: polysaccharide deacetylase family protein, partial [Alphaproteobacteria bacterium]|nr:polysaccharide deacetylase family protein [Alphaproteobacteria bacterium]
LYDELVGPDRFAMLVVPDHWGEAPLSSDPAFQSRLRRWAEAGIEMFVHGWYHRDVSAHTGAAAFKAKHMTACEGEFLGLDADTARTRMREGRALIEDVIGMPVAGFIAPAWLYGDGARQALIDLDFALAEDHLCVWEPVSARTLARGPVITWASRSRWRTASSLFFAGLARQALQPLDVVRIAVHPGDTSKPEIMESIRATVQMFVCNRSVSRYASLA